MILFLKSMMEMRGLSEQEFARAMKLSPLRMNKLLAGHTFIDRKIAKQLHLVLGQPIVYWEKINKDYWTNLVGPEGYKRMLRTNTSHKG